MFQQTPPITKNLIIINVLMFAAQYVFEMRGIDLSNLFGLHFALAEQFHVYQLFTYMFLHGGFTHLFFNMFSLWMFGRIIEQVMGSRRFLLYYLVCGIGAGLCQELWQTGEYFFYGLNNYDWVNTGTSMLATSEFLNLWTTIGASGACYGVLLAYGMSFPNERIMLLLPPIPMKAKYFVVGYAAIELVSAFASNGNIAHFAHLGGMLFGLLLLLHWRKGDRGNRGGNWYDAPRGRSSRWQEFVRKTRDRFTRRSMSVTRGGKAFKDRGDDYDFNARRRAREERTDAILDKIKRSGYDSLTDDEKKELFQNSKR